MTDNLRDRIADALRNMTGPNASGDPISYEGMADAVIRELNLTTPVEYLSVDGKRRNWMVAGHYTMEVAETGWWQATNTMEVAANDD